MIDFIAQDVEMPQIDLGKIMKWIYDVAQNHDKRVGNLTYVFCNDDYILSTNRDFLNHDYFTDIITFDYTRGNKIEGDMVISLDTVKSNADQIGADYHEELLRVIIHGVLHLCGINDKGPGEREIMEKEENSALALYKAEDNW